MSVEAAKLCIERIKNDEDFAKMVMECKDIDARIACVRVAGYDFTHDEFQSLTGQLNDDELSAVTGGQNQAGCGSLFWPGPMT